MSNREERSRRAQEVQQINDNGKQFNPTKEMELQSIHDVLHYSTQETADNVSVPHADVYALQVYDHERLNEVHAAMSEFVDESKLQLVGQVESVTQVFGFAASYVQRAELFGKHFSAFNSLTSIEQSTVMKSSYGAIFAIYSSFNYCKQQDGFAILVVSVSDK